MGRLPSSQATRRHHGLLPHPSPVPTWPPLVHSPAPPRPVPLPRRAVATVAAAPMHAE